MDCSICLGENTSNIIQLECGHLFHYNCISQLKRWVCPLCRDPIDIQKVFDITDKICINDEVFHSGFGYSPVIKNGPCRFCFGYPLPHYLEIKST